ncbi:MAG: coproporphyrinogen dehydrogenase HemZ [Lachnospiraceae bacterium]|nr:coproporphyrinogen dehydrogenase HemZ [Lachnospiraceae bacterium]
MDTIVVTVDNTGFDYDIHSLVKAFFPECDVSVLGPDDEKDKSSSEGYPDISISFGEEEILLTIMGDKTFGHKVEISSDYDRTVIKNLLKRLIYTGLFGLTGKTLPWGTLTGIRPTKIPMQFLDDTSDEEIREYMKEVYMLSDEKLDLCIDIAKREHRILKSIDNKDSYSLYIGIPFCPTRCLYCSFTSYPIATCRDKVPGYLNALFREMDEVSKLCEGKHLNSVYIGGGTPTALEADELDRLLSKLESTFDLRNIRELTVEAGRPDSITADKLRALKKHNVTRISVNPQSMNQKTLDDIGRLHSVEMIKDVFKMARDEGFDNINMDIILGLPDEGPSEVSHTIEEIVKLSPDSLTVHSLAIKRASKMAEWIQTNGISTLNNTDETMKIASDGAYDMGMKPYYLYRQKNMSGNFENVGYAREGKEGIYNILIMEEVESIVALGAGTVTKRVFGDGRIERTDNVKDIDLYINSIDDMIERKIKLFGPR